MIGIYKITNPNNKVYIGQSIDIQRRFNEHKRYNKQDYKNKLYNSFNKYGYDNHTFEIIEECLVEKLNERERYYQDLYNCVENGLNILYTNTESLFPSEYHKQLVRLDKRKLLTINKDNKSYKKSKVNKNKFNNNKKYYVLDINTGVYYYTISEASKYYSFSTYILIKMLRGFIKNKTTLILV